MDVPPDLLAPWGSKWLGTEGSSGAKSPNCFDKKQGMEFGHVFDDAFGSALAAMLGNVPVERPNANALTPARPDCVEVGTTRVIGGIRPQNYDAAYRPDGPRVVFDSKTLNDERSIRKNWQNMINDFGLGSCHRPHSIPVLRRGVHRRLARTCRTRPAASGDCQHLGTPWLQKG